MEFELRPITQDEFAAYNGVDGIAFGGRTTEADLALRLPLMEFDRSLAAFDGEEMVGTAGAYSLELTLPGRRLLPVPGVTWVSVLPSHRRQGILRAMMARQLDDIASCGEPIAILTASESAIYGRFGYGLATSTLNFSIERQYTRLARPPAATGRVRYIEHAQALEIVPAIYDQARRARVGAINRAPARWLELFVSPDTTADGFGPRFYAVYESASGEPRGYLTYRVNRQWEDAIAKSELLLRDLWALEPEGYAALWQFVFGVDLIQTVRALARPVDEPLRWLLADPRRMRLTGCTDDLWVRLLDIPSALSARAYMGSGRITFEVADAFRPQTSGEYTLEVGVQGAACQRTSVGADLALDVADLGAAYLGGVSFTTLANAGRVRELRAGALDRADVLFHVEPAPYCGTPF
jgi:predicted acetyltransferase